MNKGLTHKIKPPATLNTPALWCIFYNDQILLHKSELKQPLPKATNISELGFSISRKRYLGLYQKQHCFVAETAYPQINNADLHLLPLEQAYPQLGNDLFTLASEAKQILTWDKVNQFCSHCGSRMLDQTDSRVKLCPKCEFRVYPQLYPTITVLITHHDEILLTRSKQFYTDTYSTLTGFINPGESAEDAVSRLAKEKLNFSIKNIRYSGTQPWPFFNSFIIGFTAEYEPGISMTNNKGSNEAKWFSVDKLPNLPIETSIAKKLIDSVMRRKSLLGKLQIRPLAADEHPPWELLLTADPGRKNINEYLPHGRCFVARIDNELVGEYVLLQKNKNDFEIMNLAVSNKFQRNGIGCGLIKHACKLTKQSGGKTLWIGTSNSSIHQLKLYQRCGFVIDNLLKGYFTTYYPQKIIENGIQCSDKIYFKKEL